VGRVGFEPTTLGLKVLTDSSLLALSQAYLVLTSISLGRRLFALLVSVPLANPFADKAPNECLVSSWPFSRVSSLLSPGHLISSLRPVDT